MNKMVVPCPKCGKNMKRTRTDYVKGKIARYYVCIGCKYETEGRILTKRKGGKMVETTKNSVTNNGRANGLRIKQGVTVKADGGDSLE